MKQRHQEGWGLPDQARKPHYFARGGRAMCGRWALFGSPIPLREIPHNACRACVRELTVRGEIDRVLALGRKEPTP